MFKLQLPSWLQGTDKRNLQLNQETIINSMEDNRVILFLDSMIDFLEASIMRLSIMALWAGAIMGTVAILTPQFKLSSIPWFNLVWAIVQALALDGLFVGILFNLRDKWGIFDKPTRLWYLSIAILLGIVATLVNCTLAYQEIHQIQSVTMAMAQLGISQVKFSYARAILTVLVTALICTLPRKHSIKPVPVISSTEDPKEDREIATLKVELLEVKKLLYTICEVNGMPEDKPELLPSSLSTYERIREYMEVNPLVKNKDIAVTLGIPESTVKVYAAKARKELQIDRVTDSIPVLN